MGSDCILEVLVKDTNGRDDDDRADRGTGGPEDQGEEGPFLAHAKAARGRSAFARSGKWLKAQHGDASVTLFYLEISTTLVKIRRYSTCTFAGHTISSGTPIFS